MKISPLSSAVNSNNSQTKDDHKKMAVDPSSRVSSSAVVLPNKAEQVPKMMTSSSGSCARLLYKGNVYNDVNDINAIMSGVGFAITRLKLPGPTDMPHSIREALEQVNEPLTPEQNSALKEYFLLPRDDILSILGSNVKGHGGGTPGWRDYPATGINMTTLDVTHNVRYPQLHVASKGVDYSRFDKLHRNVGTTNDIVAGDENADGGEIGPPPSKEEGSSEQMSRTSPSNNTVCQDVYEIGQLLAGGPLIFTQLAPDRSALMELHLYASSNDGGDEGWTVTFPGSNPHIGSIARASLGTKVLVQVVGAADWEMKYL